jgi:hypothetical protein
MNKQEESFKKIKDKTNYRLKMKKNEELQNEIHFAMSRRSLLPFRKTGVHANIGKYMKIFSYLVLFTGIGIVLNSCMAGYIASEPTYTEYARPQRLNEIQIWIDGDWNWNYRTHAYVQKAGYWEQPRQGQSYVAGRWQTTQHGKSWTKGYWQKDNRKNNNRQNDNQKNDKHSQ